MAIGMRHRLGAALAEVKNLRRKLVGLAELKNGSGIRDGKLIQGLT
jgi:hypothetical protein